MTTFSKYFPLFIRVFLIILSAALLTAAFLVGWGFGQKSNTSKKSDPLAIVQTDEEIEKKIEISKTNLTQEEEKVIKADTVKTEAPTVSTSAGNTTIPEAKKTYTNQYFPNFKVVYPESWAFKTETSKSGYADLVNRKIILQKNSIILELSTQVLGPAGCGPFIDTPPAPFYTTSNGLKEYKVYDEPKTFYSKSYDCNLGNILKTNIEAQTIKDFPRESRLPDSENGKYIVYVYSITTNINPEEKNTNPLLTEVRQILENSTFN
jgi:hypothetical protein